MVQDGDLIAGGAIGDQQVIAGNGEDDVGGRQAGSQVEGITSIGVVDGDIARPLGVGEFVVAIAGDHGFGAGAGDEGVVAAIAGQGLITGPADQGVTGRSAPESAIAAGNNLESRQTLRTAIGKEHPFHGIAGGKLITQRDLVASLAVGDQEIVARLANSHVGGGKARAENQFVVSAGISDDGHPVALRVTVKVISDPAAEGLGADPGDEGVVATVAEQGFHAAIADQRVIPLCTGQGRIAGTGGQTGPDQQACRRTICESDGLHAVVDNFHLIAGRAIGDQQVVAGQLEGQVTPAKRSTQHKGVVPTGVIEGDRSVSCLIRIEVVAGTTQRRSRTLAEDKDIISISSGSIERFRAAGANKCIATTVTNQRLISGGGRKRVVTACSVEKACTTRHGQGNASKAQRSTVRESQFIERTYCACLAAKNDLVAHITVCDYEIAA